MPKDSRLKGIDRHIHENSPKPASPRSYPVEQARGRDLIEGPYVAEPIPVCAKEDYIVQM